jgi:hypothetical protein
MNPKLLRLPYLLLTSASVCGLALLVAAARPASAESQTASTATGAAMIPAGDDAAVTPAPFLRRHGAMSMPYFSFAQFLRTRN